MDKKRRRLKLNLVNKKFTTSALTGTFSISGILPLTGALSFSGSMANAANRPTTMTTNGMVTTPNYLASQAALEILKEGGNAVDASNEGSPRYDIDSVASLHRKYHV